MVTFQDGKDPATGVLQGLTLGLVSFCHDWQAEEGSKQWTLQFVMSFSEGPKLFWVVKRWMNSKRTSKLSKQGENVAAELQHKQTWGKNNWNPDYMMLNLELVVTIWELLTFLWNHPLSCAAAAPNPPKYWTASANTLRTEQWVTLQIYKKIVNPHFKYHM